MFSFLVPKGINSEIDFLCQCWIHNSTFEFLLEMQRYLSCELLDYLPQYAVGIFESLILWFAAALISAVLDLFVGSGHIYAFVAGSLFGVGCVRFIDLFEVLD